MKTFLQQHYNSITILYLRHDCIHFSFPSDGRIRRMYGRQVREGLCARLSKGPWSRANDGTLTAPLQSESSHRPRGGEQPADFQLLHTNLLKKGVMHKSEKTESQRTTQKHSSIHTKPSPPASPPGHLSVAVN